MLPCRNVINRSHDLLSGVNFFLRLFSDVDHFQVFIGFVTILLLFYVLDFWLQGMWGLSSQTRDPLHWKVKS